MTRTATIPPGFKIEQPTATGIPPGFRIEDRPQIPAGFRVEGPSISDLEARYLSDLGPTVGQDVATIPPGPSQADLLTQAAQEIWERRKARALEEPRAEQPGDAQRREAQRKAWEEVAPRFGLDPSQPQYDRRLIPAMPAGVLGEIVGGRRRARGTLESDVPDPSTWAERGGVGFGEQFGREGVELPFDPRGLLDVGEVYIAAKRLQEAGDQEYVERDGDVDTMERFVLSMYEQQARGHTLGGKVAMGLGQLPAWMIEFAVTGGWAGVGRKAGRKVATKALGRAAATRAGRVAARGAGWIGAGALRTVAMPHRVGEAYIENRLPTGIGFDESGELTVQGAGDAPATAFMRAFGDVLIENMSEEAGEGLVRWAKGILSKFPGAAAPMRKVGQLLKKLTPKGKWGQWAKSGFSKAGYDGIIGEIGEERLAGGMRAIFNTDKNLSGLNLFERLMANIPGGEDMLAEVVVLSVPGATRYAAGAISARAKPAETAVPEAPAAPTQEIAPPEAPVGVEGGEVAAEGQEVGEAARQREMGVLNQYLVEHDASKGRVPARQPYLPSRDEAFAERVNRGEESAEVQGQDSLISDIENVEDAIRIGERLGYHPDDIAAYLQRNYVDRYAPPDPAEQLGEVAAEGEEAPQAEEEVAPAEAPQQAKQPWEMTQAEWAQSPYGAEALLHESYVERGKRPDERVIKEVHNATVHQALRKGKPVPPEVLADYPDLAQPEQPATPEVAAEAKQASRERRALEREIITYHRREIQPIEQAREDAVSEVVGEGQQYGAEVDFDFAGPLPGEITDLLPRTKTGAIQEKYANLFRGEVTGATGETSLTAIGAEEMVRRAEMMIQGKAGDARRAIDRAEQHATDTQDTEMLLKIRRYRSLSDLPSERVRAGDLAVGDTFEIAGEQFKVTEEGEGYVRVEDGIEGYLPDDATVAADTGSVRRKAVAGRVLYREGKTAPMAGGFLAVPGRPTTTDDAHAARIEDKQPGIVIHGKKRDLGVLQKWALTLGNQSRNAEHPLVQRVGRLLVGVPMKMSAEFEADVRRDGAEYRKLPREYRRNKGERFFELMDRELSPEQIDAATDIPDAVKPTLKHFKRQDERMRLAIIRQKRAMAEAMYRSQDVPTLAAAAKEAGLYVQARQQGNAGLRLWDMNQEQWTTKEAVAAQLAQRTVPDSWGKRWAHIQHIFFGQYELAWIEDTEDGPRKHFIGRAENQAEAYEKLNIFRIDNPDIPIERLEAVPEMNLPLDVMRIGRRHMQALQAQLKDSAELANQEVRDALRGVIGKKESKTKYWGAMQHRKGAEGYSTDFLRVWKTSLGQFYRWHYLTQLNRTIQPMAEQIRADGYKHWADHLEHWLQFLWGKKRGVMAEQLDRMLSRVPVLGRYVKPFALERLTGMIKSVNYWRHLQTGRFYVINSFQPLQTLWPVVGTKGMYRALKLLYSAEGREILRRHHVGGMSSKLHEAGMRHSRFDKFTPAGASEMRNQALSFLALYDHGVKTGLDDAAAADYARDRGQIFTQFAYTPADIPRIMRGPIGGMVLQYRRFTIKQLELLGRLARDRRYGGVARWVIAQAMLGGVKVATLGMGAAWLRALWRKLRDEEGEEVADAVVYGLPGLAGVDMSGSINLIDIPYGRNVKEKIGTVALGPTGETAVRMYEAVKERKTARERTPLGAIGKIAVGTSPTVRQFQYLAKALSKDTSNYDSKERGLYELRLADLWRKAFGFRPTTESKQRDQINAIYAIQQKYDAVMDRATLAHIEGDRERATAILQEWNRLWPDFAIQPTDLAQRVKARKSARTETSLQRRLRMAPKRVRGAFRQSEGMAPEPENRRRRARATSRVRRQ